MIPISKVTATTVRVPVFSSHTANPSTSNLKNRIDALKMSKKLLAGTRLESLFRMTIPQHNVYPLARDAAGTDEVLRRPYQKRRTQLKTVLNIWVVADNIRKGAATNAVQIAEILAEAMDK